MNIVNKSTETHNFKMQETTDFICKITLFILCLMLISCGSTPINESRYTHVQMQIDDARKIEAENYANKELNAAQKKLEEAREADQDGNREEALHLLDKAALHAQLAGSRATTERLQKTLNEVNAGLATLQKELNR